MLSVKLVIFCAALYYLYLEFNSKAHLSFSEQVSIAFSKSQSFGLLLLIFLLQFVNYSLENLKWRVSYTELQSVSFLQSAKAVYAGNAIALFTPDRLGTFIGRYAYLTQFSKVKIMYTTFLGNYAQLCTTILFSMIGFILAWNYQINFKLPDFIDTGSIYLILAPLIVLMYSVLFNQDLLILWLSKRKAKWLKDIYQKLTFIYQYSNKKLLFICVFSALRYLVFTLQFYWSCSIFGISFSPVETLSFCGILYLFSTLIPSPFMGNLGTREAVAVYLLTHFNENSSIIAASLIIWLINIVFPSILGSIFLLTKK